jgi:hypothetical protein
MTAVLLLCLPAVAACGADEEGPGVQRVAFCQGPSSDHAQGDPVLVEFRQGSAVVHRAYVSIGVAFTAEVPAGATQIYVNGIQQGGVVDGVPTGVPYRSPGPDHIAYVATSADGCPEQAPLPQPSGG